MKLFKKISAGLLLSWGFICLMITVSVLPDLLNSNISEQKKADANSTAVGGLALGLPPTALGGWLIWGLYQDNQQRKRAIAQEKRDRLQSTFFKLIEEGEGQITVLRFAKETQLSGEEARQFLDEKAREFNATFNTDEKGGISYYFQQ